MLESIQNMTFEQDLNFKFEEVISTLLNGKPDMPEFLVREIDLLYKYGLQDFLTTTQAVGMTHQVFALFKKSKNNTFKDIVENECYQVDSIKPIDFDGFQREKCHFMVNFEPNTTAENEINSDFLLSQIENMEIGKLLQAA